MKKEASVMILFFGLFFIVSSAVADDLGTGVSSCPDFGVKEKYVRIFNHTCFFFKLFPDEFYTTAKSSCEKNGGTLAMPKTKEINDFLLEVMKEINPIMPMWIGMDDKENEGTWRWEDGTEVKPWGNFLLESDGMFGSAVSGWEDCAALNPIDGRWHDYPCSSFMSFFRDRLPFICQYTLQAYK